MLLILSSVLSIRALIRKASDPTPGWRPFWLKLLMVTTMIQSSSFLKHHTAKMLVQRRYLGLQLSIGSYVKGEDIMLFPEPEKELIQEVQTICKLPTINPATSAAWKRSFSSQCTASEDLVSIRDGWPSNVEWPRRTDSVSIDTQEFASRNENRERNFSTAGNFKKHQLYEGLFNIFAILDSITREDVYAIFVEVVNKVARKCKIMAKHQPECFLVYGQTL